MSCCFVSWQGLFVRSLLCLGHDIANLTWYTFTTEVCMYSWIIHELMCCYGWECVYGGWSRRKNGTAKKMKLISKWSLWDCPYDNWVPLAAMVCLCVEFPLGNIEMQVFKLIGLGNRVTQRQGSGVILKIKLSRHSLADISHNKFTVTLLFLY